MLGGVEGLAMMRGYYLGDHAPADPEVSPGLADLHGLPPMHVQASADEVLVDDARELARRAAEAGVEVETQFLDGVPHVFRMFAGNLPEADESIALVAAWLRGRVRG